MEDTYVAKQLRVLLSFKNGTTPVLTDSEIIILRKLITLYPMVMIAKGKLPPPENASARVTAEGDIEFAFNNNSGVGTAAGSDRAIAVAYCGELKQAVFILNAGLREIGQAVLETKILKGHGVETWMGFLSRDESNAANSVYTGRLEL